MHLVSLILDLGYVDIQGSDLLLEAKSETQSNARQTSFQACTMEMHKTFRGQHFFVRESSANITFIKCFATPVCDFFSITHILNID